MDNTIGNHYGPKKKLRFFLGSNLMVLHFSSSNHPIKLPSYDLLQGQNNSVSSQEMTKKTSKSKIHDFH